MVTTYHINGAVTPSTTGNVEPLVPLSMLHAVRLENRERMQALTMQLVRYRLALEEAGVEPPDLGGAELLQLWRECRHVLDVAAEFVAKLGGAKELLEEGWR